MKILPVLRTILLAAPGVTAKRTGGVLLNAMPGPDEERPNAAMQLVSGLEEFTHSGPSGLVHDRVRIWSRGNTAQQAGELGDVIRAVLNGWQGTQSGIRVQLIVRTMSTSDYQEAAKVHRQIDDYDVHWGLA
jgi:hypothetical protein